MKKNPLPPPERWVVDDSVFPETLSPEIAPPVHSSSWVADRPQPTNASAEPTRTKEIDFVDLFIIKGGPILS